MPSHPKWNLTKVTTEWGQGLKRYVQPVPPDAVVQSSNMVLVRPTRGFGLEDAPDRTASPCWYRAQIRISVSHSKVLWSGGWGSP